MTFIVQNIWGGGGGMPPSLPQDDFMPTMLPVSHTNVFF